MNDFKYLKNFNFDNLLNKTLELAIYSYNYILKNKHYEGSE